MPGQSLDPSVLSTTTPTVTLQEAGQSPLVAEPAKVEAPAVEAPVVEAKVEETPKEEQSSIPEKFRGKPTEEIVKSYEHAEAELTRARQREKELEHKLWAHEEAFKQNQVRQPIQGPTEEQIFQQEWEIDPQRAVYNQTQRLAARVEQARAQTNTTLFYENAKRDEANYPKFRDYEPRMMELANQYIPLVNPAKINSPEVIDLLYKMARSESVASTIDQARISGSKEAENRRKETQRATFESPTPVSSSSQIRPEDMTLEQLEKELGFVKRA